MTRHSVVGKESVALEWRDDGTNPRRAFSPSASTFTSDARDSNETRRTGSGWVCGVAQVVWKGT